jgi:peptidoglycan/xylan/chitin deacetylase (PgdA/CDA1 family)
MHTMLPILTFHSLDDRASVISFSPQRFERGLAKAKDHGFRTLDLVEVADLVRRRAPFPERCFAITFDDGYRNTFDEAFPVLTRLGMSATVFLTVGRAPAAERLPPLNGREMLSWDEIRAMRDSGLIRFGAHTLTHPDLSQVSREDIDMEVRGSKAIVEDAVGVPVDCFAYPFGRFDDRSYDVVRSVFRCACSDRLDLASTHSDVFALARVDAYYLRADWSFGLLPSPSFRWYVWSRSVPRAIRRAVTEKRRSRAGRSTR